MPPLVSAETLSQRFLLEWRDKWCRMEPRGCVDLQTNPMQCTRILQFGQEGKQDFLR